MHRNSLTVMLSVIAVAGGWLVAVPAMADMNTPITYKWTANKARFSERIKHIQEQIDLGQSKGWLTEDQVAKFKADYAKVNSMEQDWQSKGNPAGDVEALEKEVTSIHHYLHNAIAIGADHQAAAANPVAAKPSKQGKSAGGK